MALRLGPKKLFSGISSNVIVLGLVSFFNDMSSEMIFPLLPLFMANVLGVNTALIGLIEGIAESLASLLKAPAGYLSDRWRRRKPFVLCGYGLSAFTKPLFALAGNWQQVLLFRSLDRTGKGLRTSPRDALLADSTQEKVMGKSFGFHQSLDTLGAILGPAIAFLLITFLAFGYREVFAFSFIPALIGLLLIIFFVREVRKPVGERTIKGEDGKQAAAERSGQGASQKAAAEKPGKEGAKITLASFSTLVLRGPALPFFAMATLFGLANFSSAFLFLRANDLGIGLALVPLVYLLCNIIYAAMGMPIGSLSDKLGRKNLLSLGYLLFALMCFAFAFPLPAWAVPVLFVLYGITLSITEILPKPYLTDLVPASFRGSAFGTYYFLVGIAALPSSVIVGFLWNSFGSSAAFFYAAALALLAALGLFLFCPTGPFLSSKERKALEKSERFFKI